ncbi:MAG TPA: histidine kinase [Holophagaceae bacterium]|nr:histidine kinase [Holophagaceae bacterium]
MERLRGRLRQPVLWAAFGTLFLPYAAYMVWDSRGASPPLNAWGWASIVWGPLNLFSACIWLAPIPWEWAWPAGRSRRLWKGVLASLAFALAFGAFRIATLSILRMKGHLPVELADDILTNATFLGPGLMLVGGAIAGREISDREGRLFQRQAEEAQTRLLQSQLHPHVLFNSLNGLAELALKDPPRAERSIRALSDLLRKLLEASQSTYLPLSSERALVEDYLAVESMRLGERLAVEWQWDPGLDGCAAIPLLLQPLAENAIKHGIAPQLAGGRMVLGARREGAEIRLTVRTTGAPLTEGDGRGLGLANLRFRLALAYGEAAGLGLAREGDWTAAEVRIPWETP